MGLWRNKLFQREPEYDENGKITGYKLPPVVWILVVGVFIHQVSKSGGQGGGSDPKLITLADEINKMLPRKAPKPKKTDKWSQRDV